MLFGKPPAALINRWERNTIHKILSVFRVWCLNLRHFGGKLGLTRQNYHCSSIKLMAPLPRIGQWANWGSIPFWSVFNEKLNIYVMQAFLHWHPRQDRQKNTFLDSLRDNPIILVLGWFYIEGRALHARLQHVHSEVRETGRQWIREVTTLR